MGEGLSRLWVAHGDEDPLVALDTRLSYDMGLFLQKTNIIRDYLEDLVEGRAFWVRVQLPRKREPHVLHSVWWRSGGRVHVAPLGAV